MSAEKVCPSLFELSHHHFDYLTRAYRRQADEQSDPAAWREANSLFSWYASGGFSVLDDLAPGSLAPDGPAPGSLAPGSLAPGSLAPGESGSGRSGSGVGPFPPPTPGFIPWNPTIRRGLCPGTLRGRRPRGPPHPDLAAVPQCRLTAS